MTTQAPTPATHLTADWTTRAHGTEAGAGAPPSPPGGGSRGDIVMSPAMCVCNSRAQLRQHWPLAGRALSAVATGSLRGYELVNQGGRGGALEAIFHSILDLGICNQKNNKIHWNKMIYLCVGIQVWSFNFIRIHFHFPVTILTCFFLKIV